MSAITETGFASRLLLASAGLLVWGGHFLFIYVFAALACARAFADMHLFGVGVVPLAILASTVVALLLLAWLSVRGWRTENRVPTSGPNTPSFLRHLGAALGIYSAVAILLQALPVLIIPVCK
jgi:hypothetical protein